MPRDGGFLFLDQSEKEKFELEEPQSIHFIKKFWAQESFSIVRKDGAYGLKISIYQIWTITHL